MIETAVCDSFLREREDGVHQAGDDYRLLLIRRGAKGNYGAGTASIAGVLANGDEAHGNGYPAGGGIKLSGRAVMFTGAGAEWSFADVLLGPPIGAPVSLAIEGAIIYNASRADRTLSTHKLTAPPFSNAAVRIRLTKVADISRSA